MKLFWILSISSLFIELSCQQPRQSIDNRKTQQQEIKQTLQNYFSDIAKEGLHAEFKYLDSSEHFFWVPPNHHSAISYDSVKTILLAVGPKFKSFVNSWDSLTIYPLSDSLATYTGRLTSVRTDTSGNVSTNKLMETGIMIKRNTGWKLLQGQTSVIINE